LQKTNNNMEAQPADPMMAAEEKPLMGDKKSNKSKSSKSGT
jgi:hypothetical protein